MQIYMNQKFLLKGIINLGVETPKQIVVLQEERIIFNRAERSEKRKRWLEKKLWT